MMKLNKVIDIEEYKKRKKTEEGFIRWVCGCGSDLFYIIPDNSFRCMNCDEIKTYEETLNNDIL